MKTVAPVGVAGGVGIPGLAVRVAVAVVGVLLSLADHGLGGWVVVAAALGIAAACAPRSLLAWALIAALAAGQGLRHPHLDWRFLVLLAGVHLLHVLGMLSLELPWRARVAPGVLAAPLRRFVAIQVPVQVIAALCLLLLAPGPGDHRPLAIAGLAVLGAAATAGIGRLLFASRVG